MVASVLALDVGTSMVKAVCVDASGLVSAEASQPVNRDGMPGIDTHQLWETVCSVTRDLCAQLPDDREPDAVIISAQGDGLWMLDTDGQALPRAYLWNSSEGADVVASWEQDGVIDEHFRYSGTVLWPGSQAALWSWWREHNPAEVARVASVMCAKDLISYHLTGVVMTDRTDASIPFLSMTSCDYDPDAFTRLGCEDLRHRVAPVGEAGDLIGPVTPLAASVTGLPPGIPVHLGAIDVAAMLWGQGLGEPGDVMAILGTTALSATVTESTDFSGQPAGATLAVGPSRYLRAMGSSAGAATLEWFMSTVGYDGSSRYDQMWSDIAQARAGDEIFLPYLAGERAPFLAPYATGTFSCLTPESSRGSMARAVTEGIAMAMCRGIDRVVGPGGGASDVVLTGGGAAATPWAQQVANIIGRPVTIDQRPNVGAVGIARRVRDYPSDTTARVVVEPNEQHPELTERYQRFVDLTDAMMPLWHQASPHD